MRILLPPTCMWAARDATRLTKSMTVVAVTGAQKKTAKAACESIHSPVTAS
jgi:hypothetical protein